ncbi:hypothetical protein EIKCOROL_02087 [Eikenella corrodens ATCC 23834]|uniref:Uncharacterized protein n=1 Tax=Eikenella corrodens ATCC 23834 TaxID=546274 RepID=C0DXH8_EIKCO|nr:hypothetical protein EIKCOROL_02087 [Eikenella corrodens ATCC 23834]
MSARWKFSENNSFPVRLFKHMLLWPIFAVLPNEKAKLFD